MAWRFLSSESLTDKEATSDQPQHKATERPLPDTPDFPEVFQKEPPADKRINKIITLSNCKLIVSTDLSSKELVLGF